MKNICKDISKDLKCSLCNYSATKKSAIRKHIGINHQYIHKILVDKGYKGTRKRNKFEPKIDLSLEIASEEPVKIEEESNILDTILETITNTIREERVPSKVDLPDQLLIKLEPNHPCKHCSLEFQTEELLSNHSTLQHKKKQFS